MIADGKMHAVDQTVMSASSEHDLEFNKITEGVIIGDDLTPNETRTPCRLLEPCALGRRPRSVPFKWNLRKAAGKRYNIFKVASVLSLMKST